MRINSPVADKNEAIANAWLARVAEFDLPEKPRSRVESIALKHLGGQSCKVTERFHGGFNYAFRIQREDGGGGGRDCVLRFAMPGYVVDPVAKWKSEVATLRFLQERTRVPIPRLVASGITEGEFADLGPYILMEHVEGVALDRVLQQEGGRLKERVKPDLMRVLYKDIAVWYVDLFQHSFPKIGALSAKQDEETGSWTFDVESAPVTDKLNAIQGYGGVEYKGASEA
ncbi:hypothetical protein PWT90_06938 [Aphanocladium album]|nr:hypothetical protein PWT90_06938 [Aphanocladium album]